MEDLYTLYRQYMTERLVLAVASNPEQKAEGLPVKVKLRTVTVRGETMFQATRTVGAKELHENYDADGAARMLAGITAGEDNPGSGIAADNGTQTFRQIEIKDGSTSVVVMVSKKGKRTVLKHRINNDTPGPMQSHNRTKQYVLPEGEPVGFLVELGVMTPKGAVVKSRYDKFRQINRYLEFVEDIIPSLPKGREITIIDFGCGKSYLTFALYYYLHEKKGIDVRITGLDLKKDVIEECSRLARRFGYDKLEFLHGDIADYTGTDSVDMVVTLHACDTATDYALYKAVRWGARVIFCVPCCQHELNRQIGNDELKPVFKYGLIKERMAALYTDAFRADMLEEQGYRTQILEFIDMEHTPKNILIRAVKQPGRMLPKEVRAAQKASESAYEDLMRTIGAEPTLYRLLKGDTKETI